MRHFTAPRASELERMTTAEIRRDFLVGNLFVPGTIELASTELDRLIAGAAMPIDELRLPNPVGLASEYFLERREMGIVNLGDAGEVIVGGTEYHLEPLDCLYIGMGEAEVVFRTAPGGQAAFYLLSAPAHRQFPARKASRRDTQGQEIGTQESASRRTLVQYIHEDGIQSCQLVMGFTEVARGSVWNTWPPHTHLRRSEMYLYFATGSAPVFHFFGSPESTKHVVVRDRELVLSPPWSIHTGVGTGAYSFVWGMAGENRTFADMDPVDMSRLA